MNLNSKWTPALVAAYGLGLTGLLVYFVRSSNKSRKKLRRVKRDLIWNISDFNRVNNETLRYFDEANRGGGRVRPDGTIGYDVLVYGKLDTPNPIRAPLSKEKCVFLVWNF
jgi:hypothetical protein